MMYFLFIFTKAVYSKNLLVLQHVIHLKYLSNLPSCLTFHEVPLISQSFLASGFFYCCCYFFLGVNTGHLVTHVIPLPAGAVVGTPTQPALARLIWIPTFSIKPSGKFSQNRSEISPQPANSSPGEKNPIPKQFLFIVSQFNPLLDLTYWVGKSPFFTCDSSLDSF